MSLASLASAASQPKAPLSRSRKRTVVVDDSLTILHAICSLLEHYEIVDVVGRAESGPETIDAVNELHPDLVLMDADMPGMSGLRASLLLSQSTHPPKVVLMSMDTTTQFRRACSACGAYAVIYKPKFLSELTRLVEQTPAEAWEKPSRARRKLLLPATLSRAAL
ncbi:MAG TPA: response regulator [Candidatus Angelobacter sp.]